MTKSKISVLLPTRGRTEVFERSLMSLVALSENPEFLEILLAFDSDDVESFDYFCRQIQPKLDHYGVDYTCLGFTRLGYQQLHQYVNKLAGKATGDWLFFWNDDAVMQTLHWDGYIRKHDGKFSILRIPTHNAHPYAIFPIIPHTWYKLFGYISQHQLTDAWVSQIAYMLDIIININVNVLHDRHDITGNNHDTTYQDRRIFEGDSQDPRDFNYATLRKKRFDDAATIAIYLKSIRQDISWFESVAMGKQDPWAKMCGSEYDPNKQLTQHSI